MKTFNQNQETNYSKQPTCAILNFPTQHVKITKLIYTFLIAGITFLLFNKVAAQTAIVNVNTSFVNSAAALNYNATGANGSSYSSTNLSYSFGSGTQATNNVKKLNSFTIGTDVYTYAQNANSFVKIRRVNNAVVSGNRTLLWVEKKSSASSSQVAVVNSYNDNMEAVFNGNALNQGTDNLFANQGDGNGNNNNIERLDVIFSGGIISTVNTKVGFALFERGDDNAHDPFVIAAIKAVDANGNPTAYGAPLRVATINFGNLPLSVTNYYVVRKDSAIESKLRMSTSGTQNIGGVFISFSNLGITAGEKIYGYSIIGYDLPAGATAASLVNYNNSTYYPINTSSATSQGGIDLIALTGVLSAPNAMILPPTAENIKIPSMQNTAAITAIDPLMATAASGTIASYTVQTIPMANQGILYVCTNGNCTPVTAGQILTPAQIDLLSFQPNPNFTSTVVFNYFATDSYNQISNTATYTIPVTGPSAGTLPVTILNFAGNLDKKLVQLNWQTSQEINSSYIEIQKSIDGKTFESFASITAKGNSATTSTYQIKDDLFFYLGSNIFYRLKMVDMDGKFKFSSVLMIKLDASNSKSNVKLWPVPFNDELNMEYNSEMNDQISFSILNEAGDIFYLSNSLVKKGRNIIKINQAQSIPTGVYFVTITNGLKRETIKIVKR